MKRLLIVLGTAFLMAALFRPVYMTGGECNWLLLWILVGIPFGTRRILMIPRGYDLGGTVGFVVFSVLFGGIIGGFCFILEVISALIQSVRSTFSRV